jgi:hypothetical protein
MTEAMSEDELVDPDVVIRTPVPIGAAGADALKPVGAMLLERSIPTSTAGRRLDRRGRQGRRQDDGHRHPPG